MKKADESLQSGQEPPEIHKDERLADILEENKRLNREISQCQKELQKMVDNKERYQLLFEAGNDMVFVHGYKDGEVDTFMEVNEKACQVLGYSKDEFKKLNPQDITVEKISRKLSSGGLLKGEKLLVEKTLITKSGVHLPVEINTQVFYFQGNPTALSIGRDITERKRATEALKTSEQKLRMLIYNSPIGVSTTDLQGNFLEVNSVLCQIMGRSEEELLGKHYDEFSHPDDRAKNRELSEKLLKGEISSFNLEKRFIRKNGTVVDILIRAQLIRDEQGKALYQTAVIEDVTERKKAEKIQKVLYNIAQAALIGKTIEELIGIVQLELGTIVDTTNFYVAFYDKETDTFSSPYVSDEFDDLKTWPAAKSLSAHVMKTKKPLWVKHEDVREMAKAGVIECIGVPSQVWMGAPLTVDGETNAVLAVQNYTDEDAYTKQDLEILEFVASQISRSLERKKAEQDLLVALKKANESDRLKSAFLATMSHELRTPLNAIIGFSEFLKEEITAKDVKKFGEIIHSSGLHLLSIVNDLFDITLIESGETVLRKTQTNLNLLFHEVKSIIDKKRERDNKMHIDFNLRFPENEKTPEVLIDSDKVKQILINLLKNAFKFTEAGTVTLGMNIASREGQWFVDFYVSDTGIGIDKDKHEIIFDIFRQVEDSNIRTYSGTGIGLAVAKRLTEIMGGKLGVESELGKGSTFYVSIPFEPSFPHPMPSEADNQSKEKLDSAGYILVVEDDEPSYFLIKVLLEENGLKVLWANKAEEAIRLCEENSGISVVLMDIHLPGMNGYQATEKIKALRPGLPVVAQTAYATVGDREKALQAGCNDYIAKPIRAKELLTKIQQLLPPRI